MILRIFLAILTFLFLPVTALAASNQVITILNPIRGSDFFSLENARPVDNVSRQWQVIKTNNLSATWLLRPDSLENPEVLNFIKTLPKSQELGIFMEVTPSWAKLASVNYHSGDNWHAAGSVFLTGYEVAERHQLIDAAFNKFKAEFGYFPKSVGAWWVDAGSLSYMQEKYGIVANMDVADQYSTDNYSVWGQYFPTPFYPSFRNARVPASGPERKIGVVTIQWATRDPYNSYGNGVLDSTYSVQANDYANPKYHNLDVDYFNKLLAIYLDNPSSSFGQVTVGIENDFSWNQFGGEFVKQIQSVASRKAKGTRVLTMSAMADFYKQLHSEVTPPQIIFAEDPLGSGNKVLWYQNLSYRVGWIQNQKGSIIRDLRLYRDSQDEPCLEKSCASLDLAMMETHSIDEVTYENSWVIDEGKIINVKLSKLQNGVKISYTNQAGLFRTIEFLPNDIKVDNHSRPIPVAINEATDLSNNLPKIANNFAGYGLKDGLPRILVIQLKNIAISLVIVVFFFLLPGSALLGNWKLSGVKKISLSITVGIATFTLLSFTLIFLKIWWLIFSLVLMGLFAVRGISSLSIKITKQGVISMTVILVGSFSWLLTTVKNGLVYEYGMGFWGAHGHDAIWHLNLIESLKKSSLENPIFASVNLQNYHFFYDLLLAETSRITGISSIDLYFRMFPILIAIICGIIMYQLAKSWFKSEKAANLACFFLYFGGSFGWILSYFKDRTLGGESLFWAQQGISTLINPPFAISIMIFLSGLLLFYEIIQRREHPTVWTYSLVIPLVILWGTLIEFKAYGGILALIALFIVTFFELFQKRFGILKLSIPTAVLSLLVFLPTNSDGGSLLVISPFWLINSMIDFPDRLSWHRLTLARLSGTESGNWLKFFGAETIGLLIFIIGNLGTRIIGFLSFRKFVTINSFNIFITAYLISALLLPLVFIQKGANFNIIQFLYYFLLIFNLLAAVSLAQIAIKYRKIGWVLILFVVIITLPTALNSFNHFLPARPPSRISIDELNALEFLKNQPEGVVISYPFDKKLKERFLEPIPLFSYESTGYVGALGAKPEFIADIVNLEILGIDYKGRLQAAKDILAMKEPGIVNELLKENKISYLYVQKIKGLSVDSERVNLEKIFENEEVLIYQTNQ